ncbi:pseudaminic acid synthase [bacterium]|nr:pseudaminic acid synthase [bacterium]
MSLSIAGRTVGLGAPPLVIAEISGNHGGRLERALALVDACADAGVEAIKLQTYTADTMTLNVERDDFRVIEQGSLWHGETLYGLYDRAHTPWEWHQEIFDYAQERGLIAFSSAFDERSVDFLVELGTPCIKIASFENTDLPLIEVAAKTGKPLIISTGMASRDEIKAAIDTAQSAGCSDLVLLKCTSTYPAPAQDANLRTIPDLRRWSGCEIGLSDHSLGIGVAVASVGLGATVIEKHITMDRDDDGVDSAFSMTPEDMKHLVDEIYTAWQALGKISYGPTPSDGPSLKYRRSLYFVRSQSAGSVISRDDVRSIRPGFGLEPRHLAKVVGKRLTRDVRIGDRVTWDDLEH